MAQKHEPSVVIAHAVVKNGTVKLLDEDGYKRKLRGLKLGEGEPLQIWVMREESAHTFGQFKHYYGHLLAPYEEYTGDPDGHLMFKAMYLPEGKTSLTQTTYEEMKAFNEKVEAFIRTRIPEALESA